MNIDSKTMNAITAGVLYENVQDENVKVLFHNKKIGTLRAKVNYSVSNIDDMNFYDFKRLSKDDKLEKLKEFKAVRVWMLKGKSIFFTE